MARSNPVYYIAPSAVGIRPNANGSPNDLAVHVAQGARIKAYSPRTGIGTENATYREWALKGRNRRLADSARPYTIYVRLSRTDNQNAYLVFAPKVPSGGGWIDKYPYVTPVGLAAGTAEADTGAYWYLRVGDVSLPEEGVRTVTYDTGILGTDQYNSEWNLNPDEAALHVDIQCTIGGRDAGPIPYVPWSSSLILKAVLSGTGTDGGEAVADNWTISRSTGNPAADAAWPGEPRTGSFARTGTITMDHTRETATDDFAGTVSSTFTVTAWNNGQAIASASVTVLAETAEKYEIVLSASVVSYNPADDTYSPADGVSVRIRAVDQRGGVYTLTQEQVGLARLTAAYAGARGGAWTELQFTGLGEAAASAKIPATAFGVHESLNVRLINAAGTELSTAYIAFVRDGEDSREREWIFLRDAGPLVFGGLDSDHPLPSLIPGGEVEPEAAASGADTDKNQDGWVPQGWYDEPQGTDGEWHYEYGSYRDYIRDVGGVEEGADDRRGRWGEFSEPRIWSYYAEDGVTYRCRWTLDGVEVFQLTGTYKGALRGTLPLTATLMKRTGTGTEEEVKAESSVISISFEGVDGARYVFNTGSPAISIGPAEHAELVAHLNDKALTAVAITFTVDGEAFSYSLPMMRTSDEDGLLDLLKEYGSKLFLSKVEDDEAQGVIGFLKGVWFGVKTWFVDGDGNANFNNTTVNKLLKAYNAYINKVQSTNYTGDGLLDTGWRITNDYEGGNSAATFDYLTIRKKAFFNELEIRKLSSIGGNFCLSPASGRIYRIEWYDGDDNLLGYDYFNVPWSVGGRLLGMFSKSLAQKFLGKRKRLARRLTDEERVNMRRIRCYFYTDDGTTSTMLNWTVGAQARCQTFNIDSQMDHISGGETDNDDVGFYDKDMYGGVDFYRGHKVSNTYWWRLVTAVGKGRLDDGKQHYYIEFMVNTGSDATHQDAGSDLPSVGDQVVQFGHRTRTDLQSVIMFETASVEAPCIKMYDNINSWNLNNKLVARMSPKGWKVAANKFEWMTAYGEKGVTIIRGLWVDVEKDANGQRRCYYNDVVSHNGSYWRCIVNEGTHKEDKAMTHWYTQEEIDHMSLEEQMELIDVPNYTTVEPGDATFEQQAVWQVEVSIGISPYLVVSPALVAVPCEKDGKATDAYSVSASVKLMVTNLEAAITSIRMEGADDNVKLSGNYVSVNFPKGTAVSNKDYILTVEGTFNGQKYTATDKISVYAVIRGNDAYEVSALPGQWLWNQAGANYTYEDIMRMIEEGTSPSDFGIEIDKVETLPDGTMGNSCAQLSVVNGGVAQQFQIVSVAASDNRVTAQYNNVTGRVWVTAVPNTLESGYIDVTIRYGSNVQRTFRIPFWCNLLGTWREIILGGTRASIAEKTEYYVNENAKNMQAVQKQYSEFRGEYLQSSQENTAKFSKISGILGENGEKVVTQTEFGNYKQTASENLSQLSREVNTELGKKLNTSEFKQTADGFNLVTGTQAQTMANSAENNAKAAAQGYANTAQSNVETKLYETGININGNSREIILTADNVSFQSSDKTVKDKVRIDPTTGGIIAERGMIGDFIISEKGTLTSYNSKLEIVGSYGDLSESLYVGGHSILQSISVGVDSGFYDQWVNYSSFILTGGTSLTFPADAPDGLLVFVKGLNSSGLTVYAPSGHKLVSAYDLALRDSFSLGTGSNIFIFSRYRINSGPAWIRFECSG